MQGSIQSSFTSLSATMQTNLTHILDTFMKNSEAERKEQAAERKQRVEEFRAMMKSHDNDQEATRDQQALMRQMYETKQAEHKKLLEVVTQLSQTQVTKNSSQGGG